MTAETAALALGQAYRSGAWWRARCPVHQSAGATLALKDGERGLVVVCHANCPRVDIYNELRRLGLLEEDSNVEPETSEQLSARRNTEDWHRRRRIAGAMDEWSQSYLAGATLVERYWCSRGIVIPIPATIRMHGLMYHRESAEQRPAMVGLVEHVEHGQVGIHVTYLAIDGSMKATITPNKKCFGPVGGGAVRLGPVRPDQWLIVGEGIESTASAMQLSGLSSGWAGLSANGIRNLILPPDARLILIACDNDANGVGQAAARDAAWMWEEEGRAVRVALPPTPDTDFNDILNGTH